MKQHEHRGSCHCGNLRWTLLSELSLAQLPVRTCGCRFCRKHGLLTTSDPQGEMNFILTDDTAVLRYRFDTKTADFLMCGRCGVYVGAQMEEAGRYYAIANLRMPLRRVIAAFGPQRAFWGSDITRVPPSCSYRQVVTHFTEELDFLCADDLDWIMGRGLAACLDWRL